MSQILIRYALVFSLVLAAHLLLGWIWVVPAAAAGTFGIRHLGWLVGGIGALAAWLALVVYNYMVAGNPVAVMLDTMGALLGNLPGLAIVCVTLLIGAVLGLLGGAIGERLGHVLRGGRAPAL